MKISFVNVALDLVVVLLTIQIELHHISQELTQHKMHGPGISIDQLSCAQID